MYSDPPIVSLYIFIFTMFYFIYIYIHMWINCIYYINTHTYVLPVSISLKYMGILPVLGNWWVLVLFVCVCVSEEIMEDDIVD